MKKKKKIKPKMPEPTSFDVRIWQRDLRTDAEAYRQHDIEQFKERYREEARKKME